MRAGCSPPMTRRWPRVISRSPSTARSSTCRWLSAPVSWSSARSPIAVREVRAQALGGRQKVLNLRRRNPGGAFVIGLALASMLTSASVRAVDADMISEPMAVLQGLDKITARVSDLRCAGGPDGAVRHARHHRARLRQAPARRAARNRRLPADRRGPPRRRRTSKRVFSGWMFAAEPRGLGDGRPDLRCDRARLQERRAGRRRSSGSATGKDAP